MSKKPEKHDDKQPKQPEPAAAKPAPAPAPAPAPVPAAAPVPVAAALKGSPEPAAPGGAAPAPAPAAAPKPPPPPKKELPTPVFNPAYKGRLLTTDRYWPTDKWKNVWAVPGYKLSAAILVGMILGGLGLAAAVGELSDWTPKLYNLIASFVAGQGGPKLVTEIVWAAIKILVVLHIILVAPIFLVWWERKISAHMQSRMGPMYVGGWHGVLQTVADGIKLLLKEDITPVAADRWVHRLAPLVVVAPCILAFAPVSFGHELSAANLDVGALYIFAVGGASVIGILMAGWGSGNKYSLLGGLRSAAQLVSYELPRSFSIVPVLMFAGSLNLTRIADAQAGYWGGVVPRWFIFYPVVGQIAFFTFLIASVAETNRIPFDLPEAESELVAGFHTEYSGMKFSLFFLAEYAYVFLASCLAASFFLGGGASPFPWEPFTRIPSWAWFLGKVLGVVFTFLWFRWTFPRFRVDRVMDFNWKFLLPWSFANIALAGLYLLLL